tara:strand:- start:460 stop:843 length:384 start_codon:yes stop_codon:yes gene_type:complete
MMINTAIKLLVLLFGILFLVTGLRWLLAPAGIAPDFGLALGSGIGLSSQVGDMSAFFLTLGVCILMGLTTQRSVWYYPPIILLLLTAVGRVLAWLIHDAALATQLIAPEVIVSLVLLFASRRLPSRA